MSSATPSVEIIPGHRDHRSGDRDKTDHDRTGIADHHRSEPLITIPRNRDHDRSESVITIVRNPQTVNAYSYALQVMRFRECWQLPGGNRHPFFRAEKY
jgi:hypothetical protein